MKGKETWIFAALVFLIAGYAYIFEFKKKGEEETAREEAKKIFKFEVDSVQTVRVKKSEGDSLLMEKDSKGKWTIKEPFEDLGETSSVKAMLDSLIMESGEEIKTDAGPEVYGFDKPMGTFEIKTADGTTHSVAVGGREALGGKRYIQIKGQTAVLLSTGGWKTQLDKEPKYYRNKEIFRDSKSDIEYIKLSGKKGSFVANKTGGTWKLEGPFAEETDNNALEKILSQLKGMRASEVVSDDKTDRKELRKYKLSRPVANLEIKSKGGKQWDVGISAETDNKVYLTLADRRGIFQVYKSNIDPLLKSSNDLRDKKKPFKFSKSDVQTISLKTDLAKFDLIKKDGQWKLVETVAGKEVQQSIVDDLLTKLAGLEVSEFRGKKNSWKFKNPDGQIQLKGSDDKTLLEVKWAGRDAKKDLKYVRTNLASETLAVVSAKITGLPGQTLLKTEGEADKAEADKKPKAKPDKPWHP